MVYGYASRDPDANGGLERLEWLLARALAEAGWSVAIAVPERLCAGQEEIIDGVRFVGMGPASGARRYMAAWAEFLEAEAPDWWYWQGADPLWCALLRKAREKGVRTMFSAAFDTDVLPRRALTRRRWLWPLYAWGLHSVDRIFVQHSGQLHSLSPCLQAKAEVLPGVVTLRSNVRARAMRGDYVAWVAVVRRPKRPDLLIEMARMAPDVRFVVCGGTSTHRTPEGYSERMVYEMAKLPNVDYLGHVDPTRTLEIIGNAVALLSTSDGEGFPSTFLEAWAAGTPVVSLEIDPGGVIKEKGLGFVSGTLEQAAADVRTLLRSMEIFESVSERVRSHVANMHCSEAVGKVFDRCVREAK